MIARVLGALALTSAVALAGCARGCTSSRPPIHINPSMDDQPKVLPQTASAFFFNGSSMREPVPGTVAIDGLKEDAAFFTGKGADGQFVATIPVTRNDALLERGHQRYTIYCQPCHDARGEGKGILFQRGNVPTANFHHGEDSEVHGRADLRRHHERAGLMPAYRWPIPPRTGGRSSPTYESSSAIGWQAPQARAPAPTTSPRVDSRGRPADRRGIMNGALNRKLLFVFGPVTGLVMFGAVVVIATLLTNREYKEPYRAPAAAVDTTPRAEGTGR